MEFILLDENDFSYVLEYLKNSAIWLREKDIDYWQNWHAPQKIYKDWILEGIKSGQFYKVNKNGNDIGIFRLQFQDELFWGKVKDNAGYIHSFTINRELAGQGYGYKVLTEIENFIADKDCDYLRLDCGDHVADLRKYYKNYGFKEVGETTLAGERLILMEKEI